MDTTQRTSTSRRPTSRRRRYAYEGGEVYVVDGRYYHRGADGRWVRFRARPREAAARVEVRHEEPRREEPRREEPKREEHREEHR
jgi:hypothetical protein